MKENVKEESVITMNEREPYISTLTTLFMVTQKYVRRSKQNKP